MITQVTRRFEFCYGHYLPGYCGKCATMHGHNAILDVTVQKKGYKPSAQYPTMVIDFSHLKKIVELHIEKFDHQVLNYVEPFTFNNKPPTAEVLAQHFFNVIDAELQNCPDTLYLSVAKIRLYETPNCWVEVFPEEEEVTK